MSDVPVSNEIALPAQLASLSLMAEWLAQKTSSLPVSEEWRFALDLAASETATNIIRYALHEDEQCNFTVEFIVSGQSVILRFTDTGDTFPAERLAAAIDKPLFDADLLAESGRGVKLIFLYVDTFTVENREGKNVTILEKRYSLNLQPSIKY
ncbi:ATP-binding protein [Salmonella enterica]|uniref:ATP-binding protein n=1 Tax=Salmonella enterica TaxID=28901 RepID=UPI0009AFB642|nr:ATP-binding protein [Salmonella enterica]EBY6678821.1 ATP-binding protein [Salmonella enterica subsp. enterica serovar Saphra]EDV1284481.1 ATP-binding protein [Salmonella enterica subsp. enterica]EEN5143612.1 ATP-binding protein [Salmonella enterica subsp. enterica serovar Oranienburg]EEP8162951.1 ATP-binding protein [Salmonella enterica subsp. enterica serovar Poona]QVB78790.1 ATP-binding protein [Salmonella enterica subsp. enterica serovar Rubislaw]